MRGKDVGRRLRFHNIGLGGYAAGMARGAGLWPDPVSSIRRAVSASLSWFAQRFPRTRKVLVRNRVLVLTFVIIVLSAVILNRLFGGNLASVLVSGLVVGSIFVLGATGLSLLYGIKKFANFAHGDILTLGTYMAFFVNVGLGANLLFGLVFSLIILAFVGIGLELLIFQRLEGKGPVPPLVASVGVAIVIQSSIQAVWGGDVQAYIFPRVRNWATPWFEIHPIKGVLTLAVSIVAVILLHILLSRTTLGKSMRAMSDNTELARSSGISTRNVTLWTWVLSCMLAALAGVLLGMALDVRPLLGSGILLFLFAAVIVGGIGSPYGAMIGGFIVGVVQELSGIVLDWLARPDVINLTAASAYRPVAAFLAMIVVLLLKPEGLLGTPNRRGARGISLRLRLHRR